MGKPDAFSEVIAVVLAGGKGTRISAMYPDVPKPMIPVYGNPFLHWVSAFLRKNGIDNVVYSIGHFGEQIERWVDGRTTAMHECCYRERAPLGTGGAVVTTANAICHSAWTLVLNGDSLLLVDLRPGMSRAIDEGWDGAIWSVRVDDASRFGSLVVDGDGKLVEFKEKVPGRGLINAGIYFMRTNLISSFPSGVSLSMERDVIPGMIREGRRVLVQEVSGEFIDIGTPEHVVRAEAFVVRNLHWFVANEVRS